MNYLADFLTSEGPFDTVMGFSQGAALAATLILREQESSGVQPFKCAIFLSGQLPFDCAELMQGDIRQLDPDHDPVKLKLPTANFWGANDTLYPDTSPRLSRMCAEGRNVEVTHLAGHGIPSKGDELEKMAAAFRAMLQDVG